MAEWMGRCMMDGQVDGGKEDGQIGEWMGWVDGRMDGSWRKGRKDRWAGG
jgi:hypothetical protein